MTGGFDWECPFCGYTISTSGLHEFYRDFDGNRKLYGHPVPMSEEAARCGIKGFSTTAYCPECDALRDAVVMEFSRPTGALKAWQQSLEVSRAYEEIGGLFECICPVCDTKLLSTLIGIECPRCREGMFKLENSRMS